MHLSMMRALLYCAVPFCAGVRYCVKVASVPWDPSVSQDASQAIALMQFNDFAASAKAGALANDSNTGRHGTTLETR
jgi:hypothetical protein